MKKIMFLAVATAAVLSSCSKEEVAVSAGDNQAIDFSVYTGQSTKGVVVDSESIKTSGFGVFGYYHGNNHAAVGAGATSTANYMYNKKYTHCFCLVIQPY